jgi:hypothetical protein
LIIGTFSLAGERMFGQGDNRIRRSVPQAQQQIPARSEYRPQSRPTAVTTQASAIHPSLAPASSFKPQPKPMQNSENSYSRAAEPTYHNLATNQQVEKYEARA